MNHIFLLFLSSFLALSLVACSTTMESTQQPKPGFSNITDVPLPQSANVDLNKSLVMGGGDTWTGHLVYYTKQKPEEVIDYLSNKMLATGWTKISELRSIETVMTFMKDKRVATVRVMAENGYLSNKTAVNIDMTNSNLRHAVVNAQT